MNRRGRGEGSIYVDRERSKWVGVLDLTEPGGKRVRRKVSAPTKTVAREKLAALRKELEDVSLAAPRVTTVAAVVADWLDNLPVTSRTGQRAAGPRPRCPNHQRAGKIPVRKLEARDVERMLRRMADDGMSTSTIQQVRRVLSRSLKRAMRDRLVAATWPSWLRCPRAPAAGPGR